MQTTPLNVLDELYLSFDRDDEAWSVHLEIRVDGHVDRDRLEVAAHHAAARHPMARARLAASRVTDLRLQWEIAVELDELDLEAGCRSALRSESPHSTAGSSSHCATATRCSTQKPAPSSFHSSTGS
jgi:hypothetical protein